MTSFDLDRICRETFVRQIEFHQEIGSTNTRALQLAPADVKCPLLVLAEHQTAGRGRGSNRWWAGPGSLTLSLLFDSREIGIPNERWPWISLTTGLAVSEAIAALVPASEVRLKWPNDVFLNGRKTCGILVETVSSRQGAIVIGIGLNVNNSFADAPPELLAVGTSLFDAASHTFDRTSVLIVVLNDLAERLAMIRDDVSHLADLWRERCFLQGRTVQIQLNQNHGHPDELGLAGLTGVCQGIDDDGALLLQTETGVVRCFGGTVAKIL